MKEVQKRIAAEKKAKDIVVKPAAQTSPIPYLAPKTAT